MIKSMTGYGRAEGEIGGRRLAVEVKAVNHRFLNFFCKLPPDLQRFEPDILTLVKGSLQRGQVNVFGLWDGGAAGTAQATVNQAAALTAARLLREVAVAAGVEPEVRLEHLLAVPEVTSPRTADLDAEELWRQAAPVFEQALGALDGLRVREGRDLDADMRGRLGTLLALLAQIEERRSTVLDDARARLQRRVEDLAREVPAELVAERIALEIAVFADRSDVTEEIVRLRSHIEKFEEMLAAGGTLGRKLDFLTQEMNREANTIGSKCSNADISRLVVDIKAELERIREQVQNVE